LATVNKDFKVKNGLQVTGDAVIGGTIAAATPTASNHLATKLYVDSLIADSTGGMVTGETPPEDPTNGSLWFDTLVERVNVYYNGLWLTIATIDDTLNIPDHIHDTSIDGNGLISTRFIDAGSFNSPQGTSISGGDPFTTDWELTYSGGIATDNFN
jgi:hypothetical protein